MRGGNLETKSTLLEAAASKKTLFWKVPKDLEDELSTTARDLSVAKVIAQGNVEAGAALQGAVGPGTLSDLIELTQKSYKTPKFAGVGLELGAGLGLLGIVAAKAPEVQAIVSLEICKTFVTSAIPSAANELLGNNSYKIIPTYGSFEDYEIDGHF